MATGNIQLCILHPLIRSTVAQMDRVFAIGHVKRWAYREVYRRKETNRNSYIANVHSLDVLAMCLNRTE